MDDIFTKGKCIVDNLPWTWGMFQGLGFHMIPPHVPRLVLSTVFANWCGDVTRGSNTTTSNCWQRRCWRLRWWSASWTTNMNWSWSAWNTWTRSTGWRSGLRRWLILRGYQWIVRLISRGRNWGRKWKLRGPRTNVVNKFGSNLS